ncbi:MAG: S8 family serine peptidase [Clostridiales bacterium]|nr:S8 family serine peptidase [Clostridiales bacterium]
MLKSLVAVLASIAVSFSSFTGCVFSNIADGVSEIFFGIPCTSDAFEDGFLEKIDDSCVTALSENSGIVRGKIVLIMNPETGVFKRHFCLVSNSLRAVGWCSSVDLFITDCGLKRFDDIERQCAEVEKCEEILKAFPLTADLVQPDYTPSDPFDGGTYWNEVSPAGSNWWLEAVQARQAWDYSQYFAPVRLGITDSGFQLDHPDLEGKISFPKKYQQKRNYPERHGCHVAGIIAAKSDNGVGISGICPHATLSCVDWQPLEKGQAKWITGIAIVFGLVSNVKNGAKAVNFSVGMSSSIKEGKNKLDIFSRDCSAIAASYAMAALLNRGYDFIAVHSAGNGNKESKPVDASNNGYFASINEHNCFTGLYKYSYDDIISRVIVVGAARNDGGGRYIQTSYSNQGTAVTVAAPGSGVYSCVDESGYDYMGGTSMAAPVVTGIAGLIWSVNPDFTGSEVKDIIVNNTKGTAVINKDAEYIGSEGQFDLPMVNARLSVEEALRRTYGNLGSVSGKVRIYDREHTVVTFNGKSHTVLYDGSFSFITSEGSGEITVSGADGKPLYTADITVTAGEETAVEFQPKLF